MLTYGLSAFAAIFLIVGIMRVVEFKAAGISLRQRYFLIPLHVLGCLCFSGAAAVFAWDPQQIYHQEMSALFIAAVLLLFPLHIYVAIKRKIRISN